MFRKLLVFVGFRSSFEITGISERSYERINLASRELNLTRMPMGYKQQVRNRMNFNDER